MAHTHDHNHGHEHTCAHDHGHEQVAVTEQKTAVVGRMIEFEQVKAAMKNRRDVYEIIEHALEHLSPEEQKKSVKMGRRAYGCVEGEDKIITHVSDEFIRKLVVAGELKPKEPGFFAGKRTKEKLVALNEAAGLSSSLPRR